LKTENIKLDLTIAKLSNQQKIQNSGVFVVTEEKNRLTVQREGTNCCLKPVKFYGNLKQCTKSHPSHPLPKEDKEIQEWAQVLDPQYLLQNVVKNLTFGENNTQYLCKCFGLAERHNLQGYHNHLTDWKISESVLPFINIVNSMPTSVRECECEFSQMNLTVTSTRVSILMKIVANLMFIKLADPLLCHT
jgi:hypothetical protein